MKRRLSPTAGSWAPAWKRSARHYALFTRFGLTVAVPMMVVLAAPPALWGQKQGDSTHWRSNPSSGQLAFDGPNELDLPSQLYATDVDLMWRKQFNDRWGSMIAVRPAVASDFQTSQDAFRLTGRALATWHWVTQSFDNAFMIRCGLRF